MKEICDLLDVSNDPISTFQEYSEVVSQDLTGANIEAGFPTATWHWEQMNQADFQRLLNFIGSTGSGNVYLHTRLNQGASGYTFRTYSAIMQRPIGGERQGQNVMDVNINFVMLELIVPGDWFY